MDVEVVVAVAEVHDEVHELVVLVAVVDPAEHWMDELAEICKKNAVADIQH